MGTFGDGIFRAWDATSGKEFPAARFQSKNGAEILLWPSTTPDLVLLYADSNHALRVKVLPGAETVIGHLDSPITSLAISIDLRFAIVGCEDGAAHVFDVEKQKEVLKFTHRAPVKSVLAFSRGDLRHDTAYFMTGGGDGLWRIWPGSPPTND